MKFGDYSPAAWPSPAQQRDALRKGLGRAWQWAINGRLEDEPLLEACLRDQRFDRQVEDPRGNWLWQIIRTVGAAERFRVPILHALYDLSDERSADQLCELARYYAETRDETFRARLYAIVEEKPFPEYPWLGEDEIVSLDGEQAFLFTARVRGRLLAERQWEWDDRRLIDLVAERFGEDRVNGLLEASSDEAIRRFRESWRQEKQRKTEGNPIPSHRERMAAIPVKAVIEAAEGTDKCFWLRGWGIHAQEADLQTVLHYLWETREPKILAKLLRVFSARALPEFDTRLIELCQHGEEEVRRWAFRALEENTHPLVREFALTELQKGGRDAYVVALFIKNYQQGDEHLILDAMELPDDMDELHWLLMDVRKVLEKHPAADGSRLGIIAYALTPCDTCRFSSARLLLNQNVAPEWLREECRYDSVEDCRKLVENAGGSVKAD